MIVAMRLDAGARGGDPQSFVTACEELLDALAARPGFVRGSLGRCTDEPALWLLATEWEGVGAYRRGLSAYEVKVALGAVGPHTRDEPSAFETVVRR